VIPDRYHGSKTKKKTKQKDARYPSDIMGKQLNNFILCRRGWAF
jgi:hypothetical protein